VRRHRPYTFKTRSKRHIKQDGVKVKKGKKGRNKIGIQRKTRGRSISFSSCGNISNIPPFQCSYKQVAEKRFRHVAKLISNTNGASLSNPHNNLTVSSLNPID